MFVGDVARRVACSLRLLGSSSLREIKVFHVEGILWERRERVRSADRRLMHLCARERCECGPCLISTCDRVGEKYMYILWVPRGSMDEVYR